MKITEKIFSYGGFDAKLVCYVRSEEHVTQGKDDPKVLARPFMLVVPGGGYHIVCEREAEPIALAFLNEGYNAAVLYYSVSEARFPTQLVQLSKAMAYIRGNARELNADPDRVYLFGASAGGHLAASLGTLHDREFLNEITGLDAKTIRPDALVLAYPVITSGIKTHGNSMHYLLGENENDEELKELVSMEKQVNKNTPPAFIWTTQTDSLVPAVNSLLFANALIENDVRCELHMFPTGDHGASLCTQETIMVGDVSEYSYMRGWFNEAVRFLNTL